MNMKTRLYLLYIVTIVLTTACENEIPYNSENRQPQLIMNALLDTGKKTNEVFLHLSEGNSIGRLNEATLTLFVNGRVAETPRALSPEEIIGSPESGTPIYHYIPHKQFHLTTPLHPGDNIRLEATAENGQYRVSAEVTVPHPVESLYVDTCLAYLHGGNGEELYRQYKITLQDRSGEKNHYRLDIENLFEYRCQYREYIKDENGNPVLDESSGEWLYVEKESIFNQSIGWIINREDVILTDGKPGSSDDEEDTLFPTIDNAYNIFTDNRFSNASATLKVYTPHYNDYYPMVDGYYPFQNYYPGEEYEMPKFDLIYYKHTIFVRLLTLTESEYRYLQALNYLNDDDYSEALMEPVSLPNNVKGGLGFVGVASERKIIIDLPEVEYRPSYPEEDEQH